MSGRPRTTSFAESCKPVQQPSAFGSMKVSSEQGRQQGDNSGGNSWAGSRQATRSQLYRH
uniref:Glycogen synthase kinase 3 beta n=1 Tax=Homo sapiens TaxID=9606 RepID=A0A7I2V2Y0_HUMAN